jgi:hypothetical protein
MQDNPISWLVAGLVIAAVITVIWMIGAGANGYTLGSPPLGSGTASCYQIMRVDFVIPMWKAADPITCGQATIPSTAGVCSDPNAPADGNISGEEACR